MRSGDCQCGEDSQGRVSGSVVTPSKPMRFPAARLVLHAQDLGDKIVLSDALHTNHETAQQIL